MEEILFKDHNIFYNVLCFLITENEKLFDRSDAKLYWTTVYQLFGVLHHIYVTIFASSLDLKGSEHSYIDNLYRFSAGFLTGWNFLFQTCFLTMSLAYDLLEWIDRHESKVGLWLKYYKDILFSGIVVPLTLFISSMFWIIYWIDRELVFPQVYDQIVPWWFNHCVHTNILIVVGLETILQARRYPANMKLELWLTGIIGVVYAIVYYSIFFITNRWLYGVFGIMTWWQVCLFQILIWTSTFIFYFIQFPINRLFHKEEAPKISEQKTDNQNTEMKAVSKPVSLDSWSLKFRPNGMTENSCL